MENRIVIKIPQLRLMPILILLAILLLSSCFIYWYQNVRPYFSIKEAHLNAYSTLACSDTKGRIVEIGPQEGEPIKKGDLLFSFDRDLLLCKHNQLNTSLNNLNTQIQLEQGRMLKAMDGYLASANELEIGLGNPDEIQKQLALLESAQNQSEEAQAKANALKIEIQQNENELKKRMFCAPFDGIILKRYKNGGDVVSFGDPVYSICDPEQLWVEAEIGEAQIQKIAIGTPAKIELTAFPNKKLTGKISYIGSATSAKADHLPLQRQKVTVPIKITLTHRDPELKPGLSAKVSLKLY